MDAEIEIVQDKKRIRSVNSEVRRLVGSNAKLKVTVGIHQMMDSNLY